MGRSYPLYPRNPWFKRISENLKKSVDTLQHPELKTALHCQRQKSLKAKIEKSVDAFLAFRLEATLHIQIPSTSTP